MRGWVEPVPLFDGKCYQANNSNIKKEGIPRGMPSIGSYILYLAAGSIMRRDYEGWLMLLLFLRENFLFVGFETTFYLFDVFTRRQ